MFQTSSTFLDIFCLHLFAYLGTLPDNIYVVNKIVPAGSSVLNEVIGYIEDQTGRSDINWATALENCVDQKGSQKLDDCIRDTLNHHEKKTENLVPGNIGEGYIYCCKYFNIILYPFRAISQWYMRVQRVKTKVFKKPLFHGFLT